MAPSASTTTSGQAAGGQEMGGMDMHDGTTGFGSPAPASAASRTIAVTVGDSIRVVPAAIDVKAGETVAFRVDNTGKMAHEFVLGDDAAQQRHGQEMKQMGGTMAHDEPSAIFIQPGQHKTIAWTFTEPGTFKAGCHVPGHFEAGMWTRITVA